MKKVFHDFFEQKLGIPLERWTIINRNTGIMRFVCSNIEIPILISKSGKKLILRSKHFKIKVPRDRFYIEFMTLVMREIQKGGRHESRRR